MNCAARRNADRRQAASELAVRASSLCTRPNSLFTRFSAAANTCLRWSGCSAVPGKLPTARLGLAPDLALLLSRQRALLVAHLSQANAQGLQRLGVMFVDRRMVRGPDGLVLFVAEKTALELAGYRHARSSTF